MHTYTLSEKHELLARSLGMKLTTPGSPELAGQVRALPSGSPDEIMTSAREAAKLIAQDIRGQGLEPKDTQVLLHMPQKTLSAYEDALKAEGLKAVYVEYGKDQFGVDSTFLREGQNVRPEQRAVTEARAVSEVVDLGRASDRVAAAETTLTGLPQNATSQDIRRAVDDYVKAAEAEFNVHGAAQGGRAVVMSETLPRSLSTLVESRLQERGMTPLHSSGERSTEAGSHVTDFVESANEAAGSYARGLSAARRAMGDDGKQHTDRAIESAVGRRELMALGQVANAKERSGLAQELMDAASGRVKDESLAEIAHKDNAKFSSASYKDKYEFPSGVPKDAAFYFWVGERSNVVAGWGGTSADMARGMDRIKDFMDAKGHDVSKQDIRQTFGKKELEHMGREGFDAKKFDATYSAMIATAKAMGDSKPTALDALYTQQRLEHSGISGDVKVLSNGRELCTAEQLRERVSELTREGAARSSAPSDATRALESSAAPARESTGGAGSAWDVAFAKGKAPSGRAAEDGSESEAGRKGSLDSAQESQQGRDRVEQERTAAKEERQQERSLEMQR